jgi:2-polyprenyl-3-methyl-5-hydroxy-6-metoxy-1,4-benzoquinol methylase
MQQELRAILESSSPSGTLKVYELPDGRRRLEMTPSADVPTNAPRRWDTAYPLDLIKIVLRMKGPVWTCDEIMRDEDPGYVRLDIEKSILSFVASDEFAGKRLLDFGCGSGASTANLARMLPQTALVGVEMDENLISLARARADFYGNKQMEFHRSPSGTEFPPGLGQFDFVVLSAVFEHLLPEERAVVMGQIWSALKPGGVLFVNQTPHRYWPIEGHTTGLPLINYLPKRAALFVAQRFGRTATERKKTWAALLRGGIRGGTATEILHILRATKSGAPALMKPGHLGNKNLVDVWYSTSSYRQAPAVKSIVKLFSTVICAATGIAFVPTLFIAIRKLSGERG